jgi:hypothetical protein
MPDDSPAREAALDVMHINRDEDPGAVHAAQVWATLYVGDQLGEVLGKLTQLAGPQTPHDLSDDQETNAAIAAWVRAHADEIRQAIFDAACYRGEHGLPAEGRKYDQLAEQFSEMAPEETP